MLTAELAATWVDEGTSESFRPRYAEFILALEALATGLHAVYDTRTHEVVEKGRLAELIAAKQYETDASRKIAELTAELTTARADLEAARRDAERYRWLRHGDHDEAVMMIYAEGGSRKFDPRFDACWLLRNADLDAAIDEALSGAKDNG